MKIKITFTMDEKQANWFVFAIEGLVNFWPDGERKRFFSRLSRVVSRRLTLREPDKSHLTPGAGGSE